MRFLITAERDGKPTREIYFAKTKEQAEEKAVRSGLENVKAEPLIREPKPE